MFRVLSCLIVLVYSIDVPLVACVDLLKFNVISEKDVACVSYLSSYALLICKSLNCDL